MAGKFCTRAAASTRERLSAGLTGTELAVASTRPAAGTREKRNAGLTGAEFGVSCTRAAAGTRERVSTGSTGAELSATEGPEWVWATAVPPSSMTNPRLTNRLHRILDT